MHSEFECDQCGCCCRSIRLLGKPYAWLLDDRGLCRYFDEASGKCGVYAIRPLLCRVEEGYWLFFSHLDYGTYLKASREVCGRLKRMYKEQANSKP